MANRAIFTAHTHRRVNLQSRSLLPRQTRTVLWSTSSSTLCSTQNATGSVTIFCSGIAASAGLSYHSAGSAFCRAVNSMARALAVELAQQFFFVQFSMWCPYSEMVEILDSSEFSIFEQSLICFDINCRRISHIFIHIYDSLLLVTRRRGYLCLPKESCKVNVFISY